MLAQGCCIKRSLLLSGVSIDFATNALNMIDNLTGGVVLGAFEDAMLDVVRHAVLIGEFVASTCADHYADVNDWRSGLTVHNLHAVGEVMIKSIVHIHFIGYAGFALA